LVSLGLLVALVSGQAVAYGPRGHSMVGAIADHRLAGKPVAAKIADLLDGLTLAEAALLPDTIKGHDKDPDTFQLPGHAVLEQQLIAFLKANPQKNQPDDSPIPSHHWFHFCDIPVLGNSTYTSGKQGRSRFDIVQMIPFCINVIKGDVPEDNERKITRPIAVILLAHYLGDIHQPLHIGSQYFNQAGKVVNPDPDGTAFKDNGGMTLMLTLNEPDDHGHTTTHAIFHSYWDDNTVNTAMRIATGEFIKQLKAAAVDAAAAKAKGGIPKIDDQIARHLAAQEPANWKPPADIPVEKWSLQWANEIMPTAREAHTRLTFDQVTADPVRKTAKGVAIEAAGQQRGDGYAEWSGKIVRQELHKAGWRLAELLERIVQ
jgi:hypothetical protein